MTAKIDSEGKADKPLPSFRLETLKKRSEFKEASGGPRYSTKSFTMLRRIPPSGIAAPDGWGIRFGFTVTKKVGNSVVRNRIRRRLREAVRSASPEFPEASPERGSLDLVILARRDALEIDFGMMVADVARAVAVLATRSERKREGDRSGRGQGGHTPAPTENIPAPVQKSTETGNPRLS